MELTTPNQRLTPVRGLVLRHNHRRKPLGLADVRRWLRVNRGVCRAEKADVLDRAPVLSVWHDLLASGREIGLAVSLRTDAACAPPDLQALKSAGLFDVFLCPNDLAVPGVADWLEAAGDAGLTARCQLVAPFSADADPDDIASRLSHAGVVAVNIAAWDPFTSKPPCRNREESLRAVDLLNSICTALADRGVEANLVGLPLCLVAENNLPHAVNGPRFFADHQQYLRRAYELAVALYRRSPVVARIALTMIQSRSTLHTNPIDEKILPWLLNRPWLYARVMALHKLTRHRSFLRGRPEPVRDVIESSGPRVRPLSNPECARCALVRICDQDNAEFRRVLPGLELTAREGADVVSPAHFAASQPRYYDFIDRERLHAGENQEVLAKEANDIVLNRPPDRRIGPSEYGTEDGHFAQFEGAVEWHGVTDAEKVSRPPVMLEPPFTVSVIFGGGVAEYIGFSFGRHCKLVAPMEATRHTVTLHVADDGRYVLLRDDIPIRPVEFEGAHLVPMRLSSRLELRLSIWNIDKHVFSQFVDIWEGSDTQTRGSGADAKYSVLIVNTRFARRLESVLRCLAHQTCFDMSKLEVIVCYVPGIDATDDVIDSVRWAYPQLKILRSTFPESRANSKGFIINESLRMANGDWIVLLDADTLAPPEMFSRFEEVEADNRFIAPDGRKMLTPETTAKILLGEIRPWESWDALLKGAGELRLRESHGVPIGFCQCVRKQCMEKVPYEELDHFEGADMQFGVRMLQHFGKEKRLTGMPVLHLDHGGSQWYGTRKHR